VPAHRHLPFSCSQWHPDKNPEDIERAATMFKKIARAYEVLGDNDLRARCEPIYIYR